MTNDDYFYDNYRLAEFYESIYGGINADFPVWFEAVKRGGDVLELACGTGRVTLELAKNKNINIIGLDYSEEMLNILDKKIEDQGIKNIKTIQGDMRSFCLKQQFDTILITSNSLNHIEKNDDLIKCFDTIMSHLKDDGVLIFDILNPFPHFLIRNTKNEYDHRVFKNIVNGKNFKMWENSYYNKGEQINYVNYFYQYLNEENQLIGEIIKTNIKVRLFHPQEMDMFLKTSGYQYRKYGWYDFSDFTGEGPEQIYFVKKSKVV